MNTFMDGMRVVGIAAVAVGIIYFEWRPFRWITQASPSLGFFPSLPEGSSSESAQGGTRGNDRDAGKSVEGRRYPRPRTLRARRSRFSTSSRSRHHTPRGGLTPLFDLVS